MEWFYVVLGFIIVFALPNIRSIMRIVKGLANRIEFLAKTQIDDMFFGLVETVVTEAIEPIKAAYEEANADGVVTEDEWKHIYNVAKDAILAAGKLRGIDFLKQVGPEILSGAINKVIGMVKNSKE